MRDTSDEPKRNAIWALVIAIIVTAIWTLKSLLDNPGVATELGSGQQDIAYGSMTGHGLFILLVVWTVLYFAALFRRSHRGPLYFLILLAVVVGTYFVVIMFLKASSDNIRAQESAFVTDLRTLIASPGKITTSSLGMQIRASGDSGILEAATKNFLVTMINDQKNCKNELAALDYPGFMTPSNFAADRRMRATRAKLRSAHEIIDRCAALSRQRIADFPAMVQKLPVSSTTKQEAIDGFNRSARNGDVFIASIWKLNGKIVTENQKVAALLAHPKGAWGVRKGVLHFSDSADIRAYNEYAHNIAAMTDQEKVIVQSAR